MNLVDRYGEAIEADLHAEFSVDILDFFRGVHPWGKLERLIGRLGRMSQSHYRHDLAQDDELAEQMAEGDDGVQREYRPQLEDWTPVVAGLANVEDRLSELLVATVAVQGGKPPKVRPAKRPETAADRVESRKDMQQHEKLNAMVEEAQARDRARKLVG